MPSTAAMTKMDSDVMTVSMNGTACTNNRLAAISFGQSSMHMASEVRDLNLPGAQVSANHQLFKSPATEDKVLEETENVNPQLIQGAIHVNPSSHVFSGEHSPRKQPN